MFNFINIRWNISRGAASYLVVAKGPEGPVTTCNTTTQECRLQTLHCSSSYNVSVIAVNQQCNTSGSSILRINTGIVYSFISSALCQYLYIYIYIYAFSRRFYPKRLTLHSSFYILSALAFPGNRTHDLGVASAMLYQLSYRKAFSNNICLKKKDSLQLSMQIDVR